MGITGRILLCILLAGGCCLSLGAQTDNSKPATTTAQSPQSGMPMIKPSPEMIKLSKALVGSWTVSEKMEASPMAPKGGTGHGMASMMPGPGGLSVVEKYHSTGSMGTNFNGLGTFWWDPKAQAYRGVWCDTMTPTGCDSSGTTKWEGDKLVGTMQSEMDGKMMMTRFTYSDFKPGSFVMTMEMGPDASSMQKAMTITYTRAGGGAKMAEKPADKPMQ
jgi:hypothetical protein